MIYTSGEAAWLVRRNSTKLRKLLPCASFTERGSPRPVRLRHPVSIGCVRVSGRPLEGRSIEPRSGVAGREQLPHWAPRPHFSPLRRRPKPRGPAAAQAHRRATRAEPPLATFSSHSCSSHSWAIRPAARLRSSPSHGGSPAEWGAGAQTRALNGGAAHQLPALRPNGAQRRRRPENRPRFAVRLTSPSAHPRERRARPDAAAAAARERWGASRRAALAPAFLRPALIGSSRHAANRIPPAKALSRRSE